MRNKSTAKAARYAIWSEMGVRYRDETAYQVQQTGTRRFDGPPAIVLGEPWFMTWVDIPMLTKRVNPLCPRGLYRALRKKARRDLKAARIARIKREAVPGFGTRRDRRGQAKGNSLV